MSFKCTYVYSIAFRLQKENDNLLGKHSAHSQQLQNEMINWPDKVEVRFVFVRHK
jgi:Rab GTPase-binding effector protein 1